MARILTAAAITALISTTCIAQVRAEPTLPALTIAHGQTVQQALAIARVDAHRAANSRPTGAPSKDPVPPAITGGAVVVGRLEVGKADAIPSLSFTYQAVSYGLVGVVLTFTSPNGLNSFNYTYYPRNYAKSGSVTFSPDQTAPYYAQPGRWNLTAAFIEDNQGNYTQYDQAQAAALFAKPFVDVVNKGKVDITPPVVTAGAILTPTVSLSSPIPVFEATLTGTDDVSGVLEPFVIVEAPGGSYGEVELALVPIPSRSGTFTAYSPNLSGQPAGTWSITGYALCDVVGNCFSDSNSADVQALFGTTTFTVTN